MYSLDARRRLLPRHAAVPLQRVDGRLGPGADGRLGLRAALVGPLLGLGLPARRPRRRGDVLQLRRQAAVLHPGHARAARRRRQPAWCAPSATRGRPTTSPASPSASASPSPTPTARPRAAPRCSARPTRRPARWAGPPRAPSSSIRPPARSARRPASTTRAGCSTPRRPSASSCPRAGGAGFEGYWRNDEAERARLREGWYWTGDLAYRDEAGFFYFAGRDHDWLRVDGENFASAPIERILQRHPDVVLAAVYAVPDPVVGDQVMAAVQLRPALDALDPDGLADFLAAQGDLGTKWAPRFVRMSAALPDHGDQQGAQARAARRALELRRDRAVAAREGRALPVAGRRATPPRSRRRWATGRSDRDALGARSNWLGHSPGAAGAPVPHVLLPAIPTTGALSTVDPREPQKKASP